MLSASRGMVGIVTGLAMLAFATLPAAAQSSDTYKEDEIVREAGNFFPPLRSPPTPTRKTRSSGKPAISSAMSPKGWPTRFTASSRNMASLTPSSKAKRRAVPSLSACAMVRANW